MNFSNHPPPPSRLLRPPAYSGPNSILFGAVVALLLPGKRQTALSLFYLKRTLFPDSSMP